MRSLKNKWVVGLAIVVVALALGLVIKRSQELANLHKPDTPSVSVEVAKVKQGVLPITLHYMGKIEAVQSSDITSRITANVLAVNKREGDLVVKDEALILLDDLALASKTSAMAAELRAAESSVVAAKSSYEAQQASFERDQYLYKKNAIALEFLEKSKAATDNSFSQVQVAKERVQAARANLITAQTELGYASLKAPFAGVVVKRSTEPGEVAVPGKTLLRLQGSEGGYKITVQISQEQLGQIRVGTRTIVSDGPNSVEAPVSKVYPSMSDNNLAVVEIVMDTLPNGLPAGSTVGLDFVLDHLEGLLVPVNSLVKTEQGSFVVMIDNGVAKQVPVTINGQNGRLAAVSGLTENSVVAVGQQSTLLRLMNGVKVKPAEIAGDNS